MTRRVFTGGQVFDGTGSAAAPADVVVEDGRIVEVGPGLDGDEAVDVAGQCVLPGFFDCHTHVTIGHLDAMRAIHTPFSYRFYETIGHLATTLALGITTVRDAAGADLGIKKAVADGLVPGPRLHITIAMLTQTGGHADPWHLCGAAVHNSFPPPYPGFPDGLVDGPDEM